MPKKRNVYSAPVESNSESWQREPKRQREVEHQHESEEPVDLRKTWEIIADELINKYNAQNENPQNPSNSQPLDEHESDEASRSSPPPSSFNKILAREDVTFPQKVLDCVELLLMRQRTDQQFAWRVRIEQATNDMNENFLRVLGENASFLNETDDVKFDILEQSNVEVYEANEETKINYINSQCNHLSRIHGAGLQKLYDEEVQSELEFLRNTLEIDASTDVLKEAYRRLSAGHRLFVMPNAPQQASVQSISPYSSNFSSMSQFDARMDSPLDVTTILENESAPSSSKRFARVKVEASEEVFNVLTDTQQAQSSSYRFPNVKVERQNESFEARANTQLAEPTSHASNVVPWNPLVEHVTEVERPNFHVIDPSNPIPFKKEFEYYTPQPNIGNAPANVSAFHHVSSHSMDKNLHPNRFLTEGPVESKPIANLPIQIREKQALPESRNLYLPQNRTNDWSTWEREDCLDWLFQFVEQEQNKMYLSGIIDGQETLIAIINGEKKYDTMPYALLCKIRQNFNRVKNDRNGYPPTL